MQPLANLGLTLGQERALCRGTKSKSHLHGPARVRGQGSHSLSLLLNHEFASHTIPNNTKVTGKHEPGAGFARAGVGPPSFWGRIAVNINIYVLVALRMPLFPCWREWGSNESVGFRGRSKQPLHIHCRCLREIHPSFSSSILSDVLQRRTIISSLTRACWVSAAGCVSITSRLDHRTECHISIPMGDWRMRVSCLWPYGCTSWGLRNRCSSSDRS